MAKTFSIRDFGRCGKCKTPYPLRMLDAVVLDPVRATVSSKFYGPCCHPAKPGQPNAWCSLDGNPEVTADEAAFIRANEATITEVL